MNKKKILIGNTNPLSDLASIKVEREAIHNALDVCARYVHVIREADLSWSNLTKKFFRNNENEPIELFHYAGHSSSFGVTLEDGTTTGNEVSIQVLSDFLSNRENLKIVFLNSCSSKYIGEDLIAAGSIKVVIETTQPVYDNDAKIFSEAFYLSLADGKTIQEAFDEASNILKGMSDSERGNELPRGIGLEQDDFPWRLNIDKNDPENIVNTWRLFEPIEKQLDGFEGMKVLCVFPESKYTNECYNAVKEVLNDVKKEVTEEDIYIMPFINLEKQGAFNSIDKFDSYLFFAAEGSITFLDQNQNLFKPFIQNKIVGVLSCKMRIDINLSKTFEAEINEIIYLLFSREMSLDQFDRRFSIQMRLSNYSDRFKLLLTRKKTLVNDTLKTAFIDLNFEIQKKAISEVIDTEVAQYNIFSIEGTEHCGHEVLIKKIIRLINANIKWEEVIVSIISLSNYFEATDNLVEGDIWSVIAEEVLGDGKLSRKPNAEKITTNLLEIIKKQNLIISIDDADFNRSCYEPIHNFWKSFSLYVEKLNTTNKLFFFVLNKGLSKGCCFKDKPIVSYQKCASIRLDPISEMKKSIFHSWYTNESLYNQLKADERFVALEKKQQIILKEPYVAKVIGEVCAQMDCRDIQQDVLSLKSRMQE